MRLTARKYKYAEIKSFEQDIAQHKDLGYLLDNISLLRILGWTLTLPNKHKFNTGGFGDVIKFTDSTKIILNKEAKKWNRK